MKKIIFYLFIIQIISIFVTQGQSKYPCEIELSKKAEKFYKQARAAQQKGDNDKATALYKQCIEEQEDWAVPYFYLGMQAVRRLERLDDENRRNNLAQTAIGYFEKVIEHCPEYNITAYLHLGKLNYSIGQYGKAIKYLELFLEDLDKIKNKSQIAEAEWFLEYSIVYERLYNNPVSFNPTPVKEISTENDEYLGTISPDDDYMYFTRKQIVTEQMYGRTSTIIKEIFTRSQRQSDGSFSVGVPMPSPPFNMAENQGAPTITINNDYLVFSSCTTIMMGENLDPYLNCDLFYSEYKDGQWSDIRNMGRAINGSDTWESQPSISADGNTLFFVSDRAGGFGGVDIYYSTRDANGNWKKAQNVGNVINTNRDEKTPFLHGDNKTLYYSSNGFTGLGGQDIYVSRLSDEGKWSKPVNLGYPINSEADDVGLFVSTLGNKAYFATNRISDNWDIFEFDLYEEVRPNKVILVKGGIENFEKGDDSKIELKNIKTKQIETININEETGKYAAIISNMEDDYLLTVKQKGYAYETKYIEPKRIFLEKKEPVINNADFVLKPVVVGESYKINDIYFASNSSELSSASQFVLDILIEFLQDNPDVTIEIQGHTDNIGNRNDNMVLSEERAKSVYSYLVQNYIQSNRLWYKGFADTKPVAFNNTEEERALNRRTVFVILKR